MIAAVLEDSRGAANNAELEKRALAPIARHVHVGGSRWQAAGHLKVDLSNADKKQRCRDLVDVDCRTSHTSRERVTRGLLSGVGKVRSENGRDLARRHPGSEARRIGDRVDYSLCSGNGGGQQNQCEKREK